jgi:hypothetical protein
MASKQSHTFRCYLRLALIPPIEPKVLLYLQENLLYIEDSSLKKLRIYTIMHLCMIFSYDFKVLQLPVLYLPVKSCALLPQDLLL